FFIMKVLSVKQPFAELIVSGKKSIEIRSWNTTFRGEFLLHVSKNPVMTAMKRNGFSDLETGVIIGKVTLVGVKKYVDESDFKNDRIKHLATSDYGKYGFILKNPVRFEKLIPVKGKLGFWNFDL
ncbi:MAG: ASCH domain-containing protein, partial [Nanobdellota archaeon]